MPHQTRLAKTLEQAH